MGRHDHALLASVAAGVLAPAVATLTPPDLIDAIERAWAECAQLDLQVDKPDLDTEVTAMLDRRCALIDAADALSPDTREARHAKALALAWIQFSDLWEAGKAREEYATDGRLALAIHDGHLAVAQVASAPAPLGADSGLIAACARFAAIEQETKALLADDTRDHDVVPGFLDLEAERARILDTIVEGEAVSLPGMMAKARVMKAPAFHGIGLDYERCSAPAVSLADDVLRVRTPDGGERVERDGETWFRQGDAPDAPTASRASVGTDPVLALIDAHRTASAAWLPLAHRRDTMVPGAEGYADAKALEGEASRREIAAFKALLGTQPATTAGTLALAEHLVAAIGRTGLDGDPDWEVALRTVAASLRATLPASEPAPALAALMAEWSAFLSVINTSDGGDGQDAARARRQAELERAIHAFPATSLASLAAKLPLLREEVEHNEVGTLADVVRDLGSIVAVGVPTSTSGPSPALAAMVAEWVALLARLEAPAAHDDALDVRLNDLERAVHAFPSASFEDFRAKLPLFEREFQSTNPGPRAAQGRPYLPWVAWGGVVRDLQRLGAPVVTTVASATHALAGVYRRGRPMDGASGSATPNEAAEPTTTSAGHGETSIAAAIRRHEALHGIFAATTNAADDTWRKQHGLDVSEEAMAPFEAANAAAGQGADEAWIALLAVRPTTLPDVLTMVRHLVKWREEYEDVDGAPQPLAVLVDVLAPFATDDAAVLPLLDPEEPAPRKRTTRHLMAAE